MGNKEADISPVQLEWTVREQVELLNKLASSVGDGIGVREFCILFKHRKKCAQVGARPAMRCHICAGGVQKRRARGQSLSLDDHSTQRLIGTPCAFTTPLIGGD